MWTGTVKTPDTVTKRFEKEFCLVFRILQESRIKQHNVFDIRI